MRLRVWIHHRKRNERDSSVRPPPPPPRSLRCLRGPCRCPVTVLPHVRWQFNSYQENHEPILCPMHRRPAARRNNLFSAADVSALPLPVLLLAGDVFPFILFFFPRFVLFSLSVAVVFGHRSSAHFREGKKSVDVSPTHTHTVKTHLPCFCFSALPTGRESLCFSQSEFTLTWWIKLHIHIHTGCKFTCDCSDSTSSRVFQENLPAVSMLPEFNWWPCCYFSTNQVKLTSFDIMFRLIVT